jgi:hypothetical protein
MSDIRKLDQTILSTPKDTLKYFQEWGNNTAIGVELELQIHQNNASQTPIGLKGNSDLEAALKKIGQSISQEATAQTIEIKTKAYGKGQAKRLLREIFNQKSRLDKTLSKLGLSHSKHSILPKAKFRDLLKNVHPRPRSQIFIRHFLEHGKRDTAEYFSTVSGIQTSHSPSDHQKAFDYYRRFAYLLPILAHTLNSVPDHTTDEHGASIPTTENLSLKRRLAPFGVENALPQAFWTCSADADAFIRAYNEDIWNTDIFCYYKGEDPGRDLTYVEKQSDIKPFAELPAQYRTKANFDLAQSIKWYLIRLSGLEVSGKQGYRVEASFFDSGNDDQIKAATYISHALAYDPSFQRAVDEFASQAGFGKAPDLKTKALWDDTLKSVIYKHNEPGKIKYGTGTLIDATQCLNQILKSYKIDITLLTASQVRQSHIPNHGRPRPV